MRRKIYLTNDGVERLKVELVELKEKGRKEVANRIKEAKEFGDLSENSEYVDAKDHQAFIEGRIAELEHILRNATVVKESGKKKKDDGVDIGTTVHVQIRGGKHKFTIVGSHEADPDMGKISHESPIGQALLGKKIGDEVIVTVPAGEIKYKIVGLE